MACQADPGLVGVAALIQRSASAFGADSAGINNSGARRQDERPEQGADQDITKVGAGYVRGDERIAPTGVANNRLAVREDHHCPWATGRSRYAAMRAAATVVVATDAMIGSLKGKPWDRR